MVAFVMFLVNRSCQVTEHGQVFPDFDQTSTDGCRRVLGDYLDTCEAAGWVTSQLTVLRAISQRYAIDSHYADELSLS